MEKQINIEDMMNSEKNKRIFVMAFARMNLGDDIFLKMLFERYPMHDFYMQVEDTDMLSPFSSFKNLHVMQGKDTDEELYKMNPEDYDGYIYIGGSIFMEGGMVYNLSDKFHDFVLRCKEKNIPFCYISCNYGPYQTEEYLNLSRKNFEAITDICFRDKYSYEMFKDIENVRYAPDFVFTYPVEKPEIIKDSVGISVIDLEIRDDLISKEEEYIEMMANNINYYLSKGKKIYMFTFCEFHDDIKGINKILSKVTNPEEVVIERYTGDIDGFMKTYSQMEYVICIRFHALILSSLLNHKIFILSYSKKIDEIVKDLDLNLPILKFNDITSDYKIRLDDFKNVDEELIEKIKDDAKAQESAIKKFL